jgi:hypothetical protein
MTRPDWTAADEEARREFEFIQNFVTECRNLWPGAKIILRTSDNVEVDLSSNPNKEKGNAFI